MNDPLVIETHKAAWEPSAQLKMRLYPAELALRQHECAPLVRLVMHLRAAPLVGAAWEPAGPLGGSADGSHAAERLNSRRCTGLLMLPIVPGILSSCQI